MKLFGWTIARTRDLESGTKSKALAPVDNRGGWWPIVREFMPGAWQANVTVTAEDALQYWAVFRCVSIIAGDIAKMRLKLVEQGVDGIWREIASPAFSPVLRKPNPMQTRIQFIQNWLESKLIRGNAYVLKVRDARAVVTYSLAALAKRDAKADPFGSTPPAAPGEDEDGGMPEAANDNELALAPFVARLAEHAGQWAA
jgi:phage portal protein BeeE